MTEANDQPIAKLTASGNETNIDEATSRNQAVVNASSTGHRPQLFDLPPEVRRMIFRHLLVIPDGFDFRFLNPRPGPSINILRTSRLIYEEAFEVLYRENLFSNCLGLVTSPLTQFPRIINTIRNVHVNTLIIGRFFPRQDFLRYLHHFGGPSITRGTLTVDLLLDPLSSIPQGMLEWSFPLKWFIRAMGRFTNFRTIELYCNRRGFGYHSLHVLEFLESALEPVFGKSEHSSREGNGLKFHQTRYRNRRSERNDGDWADFLDGIRLKWNEDVTNAEDPEMPAD